MWNVETLMKSEATASVSELQGTPKASAGKG
jgi:hypothetical protein